MSKLIEDLRSVGFLKAELKRRCMIYHSELKMRVANRLGLPYWAFFHMAYEDLGGLEHDDQALAWWEAHKLEAARDEAHDFAHTHGSEQVVERLEEMCLEEALKHV